MRDWRYLVRKQVIVNQSEQAFSGILWLQRGQLLILKQAQLLQPGTEPQAMDGEVVIERSTVLFIQIVG